MGGGQQGSLLARCACPAWPSLACKPSPLPARPPPPLPQHLEQHLPGALLCRGAALLPGPLQVPLAYPAGKPWVGVGGGWLAGCRRRGLDGKQGVSCELHLCCMPPHLPPCSLSHLLLPPATPRCTWSLWASRCRWTASRCHSRWVGGWVGVLHTVTAARIKCAAASSRCSHSSGGGGGRRCQTLLLLSPPVPLASLCSPILTRPGLSCLTPHCPGGRNHFRRARHQRPALVLPAHPPGALL